MDQFATPNIQILPGDVVYVPARKAKLWDKRAGPSVLTCGQRHHDHSGISQVFYLIIGHV